MTMRCKFCGQTASRMIALSLLQEFGASVSPGPFQCPGRDDDGEHEMVDRLTRQDHEQTEGAGK